MAGDAPRTGIEGLAPELQRQARFLADRVPPYARLLEATADLLAGDLGARLARAWSGRTFSSPYDRPLLLLAALRDEALAEGRAHPLWDAVAADPPSTAAATREALVAALAPSHARTWEALRARHVQTNDTSRAVAWMWPAALAAVDRPGGRPRSLALVDLGASAGLNLIADALPACWLRTDGEPLPLARGAAIVARLGLDARPLDASAADDARWLRACVWAGERERVARLDAAIAAFLAARRRPGGPVVERLDLLAAPARLDALGAGHPGALVLAYQTVVRDYLAPADRERHCNGMHDWLSRAPRGVALWVELEAGEPADRAYPAALIAHAKDATGHVRSLTLGRCAWHPSSIRVDETAAAALTAAVRTSP